MSADHVIEMDFPGEKYEYLQNTGVIKRAVLMNMLFPKSVWFYNASNQICMDQHVD